ncbi:MAG: hypothetical protein WC087_00580 [Candidatus Paceibacterota bacterium]
MQKPYIGITDFETFEQVREMLVFFNENKSGNMHHLHVGVMCSRKTINGEHSRWGDIWPKREHLGRIFSVSGPRFPIINCLHYADKFGNGVNRSYHDVYMSLLKAVGYAGPFLDALQLDMVWPDFVAIDTVRKMHRHPFKVILQIDATAFDMVDNSPRKLVDKLCEYDGNVHYVLLDKSAGEGKLMDTEFLLPFLHQITKDLPRLGIAVAGGLGPDTMDVVRPIVEEFPYVSIDAQGRLRSSGDARDPIDWDIAKKYLLEAIKIFKEYNK